MNDIKEYVKSIAIEAYEASKILIKSSTKQKDQALRNISDLLNKNKDYIISENEKDYEFGKEKNLSSAMLDRLLLNEKRINGMCNSIIDIINLKDPVFEIVEQQRTKDGLDIGKLRVPIGVIGIIYESRPNVTSDSATLCLKASNSTLLRGGSESINSNRAIVKILKEALVKTDLPAGAISFIDTTDREAVKEMLKLIDYIDLIIPRGGEALIRFVAETSIIPVIKHYKGICNIYVDKDADKNMAEKIVVNAKVQRPGVCNAVENLIIHKDYVYIEDLLNALIKNNVELRGCEKTKEIISNIKLATEDDYYEEYLDLILAVKIVDTFDFALDFISKYGSKHSDAIITQDYNLARKFLYNVDSSSVYVNASTRLTDGGVFGMGAEIGVSTDKLHARGPMGLKDLTTTKYIIFGEGQIRE